MSIALSLILAAAPVQIEPQPVAQYRVTAVSVARVRILRATRITFTPAKTDPAQPKPVSGVLNFE